MQFVWRSLSETFLHTCGNQNYCSSHSKKFSWRPSDNWMSVEIIWLWSDCVACVLETFRQFSQCKLKLKQTECLQNARVCNCSYWGIFDCWFLCAVIKSENFVNGNVVGGWQSPEPCKAFAAIRSIQQSWPLCAVRALCHRCTGTKLKQTFAACARYMWLYQCSPHKAVYCLSGEIFAMMQTWTF